MTRYRATGPEQALDGFAATLFAISAGWSLWLVGLAPIATVGGAALAGVSVLIGLQRVGGHASAPGFVPSDMKFDEPVDDTLLLEDRLPEPEAESRVVRLFAVGGGSDGRLVPGELAARIDRFLDGSRGNPLAAPAQPDAAQELYEALADIRRTLR